MTFTYAERTSAGRVATAVQWLPALTAAAYLAVTTATGPEIVRLIGWDTDVSAPFVLAERLRGSGTVSLPHIADWTPLWFELATRSLPGHVQLWQATSYVFAVLGAVLVGWATARVATRWAGVAAFAVAVIVGPLALRSLFTLALHIVPPFTAAVLAAFLVLLDQRRAWLFAVPVGILTGLNAASDPLTWPAALVPFAFASAILAATTRRREIAIPAGLTVASSLVAAVSASSLMHSLGYHELGAGQGISSLHELPGHFLLLGRMVALLGGANYALPGPYPPEPLRLLVAVLAVLAVVAPLVVAAGYVMRRKPPLPRAYACYWGAATVLLGLAFIGTTNAASLGAGSFNYLLTLAPAAGAGVALLSFESGTARLVVAAAVAVVGLTNMTGIVQGRAGTPRGAIGTAKPALVQFLVDKRVTRGYAGYWDAQNLSWQSGMRVFAAPVTTCAVRDKPLCAVRIFTVDSWYEASAGPTFLLVDPTNGFVTKPPRITSRATTTRRFGRITVYIFPFDLARYIEA